MNKMCKQGSGEHFGLNKRNKIHVHKTSLGGFQLRCSGNNYEKLKQSIHFFPNTDSGSGELRS